MGNKERVGTIRFSVDDYNGAPMIVLDDFDMKIPTRDSVFSEYMENKGAIDLIEDGMSDEEIFNKFVDSPIYYACYLIITKDPYYFDSIEECSLYNLVDELSLQYVRLQHIIDILDKNERISAFKKMSEMTPEDFCDLVLKECPDIESIIPIK